MTPRKLCGMIPHHRKTMPAPKQNFAQCGPCALPIAQFLNKNDPRGVGLKELRDYYQIKESAEKSTRSGDRPPSSIFPSST
jgi:hypothetical protein